jgi:hypothetical protein
MRGGSWAEWASPCCGFANWAVVLGPRPAQLPLSSACLPRSCACRFGPLRDAGAIACRVVALPTARAAPLGTWRQYLVCHVSATDTSPHALHTVLPTLSSELLRAYRYQSGGGDLLLCP